MRLTIKYNIGRRQYLLNSDEILYFMAQQKCVIARTKTAEVVLNHRESIKKLTEEFASDFIYLSRGVIARRSAIVKVEKHRGLTYIYQGGIVWLHGISNPIEISRRGIRALIRTRVIVKNKRGFYENNTGAAPTIEERKHETADDISAGSA